MIQRFFRNLFFTNRLIRILIGLVCFFLFTYFLPDLLELGIIALVVLFLLVCIDILLLFRSSDALAAERRMADIFSNGDDNAVTILLKSNYPFKISVSILDELPIQFQLRDHRLKADVDPGAERQLRYLLRPLTRGEYWFGAINVMSRSPLGLVDRRWVFDAARMVMVWPSFHALRHYELLAHNATTSGTGNRKIRKLGHSLEFEEIKDYVAGDDLRTVNWKATARKGSLMVNNFMDERSQQIYCVIDKSRVMKMPYNGMTLLDYAINASLVLSRIALLKYDKAGLICFDEKMGTVVPADRKGTQMNVLAESLYRQQTNFLEADYEKLVTLVKGKIKHRSLLILFTNFESKSNLLRQLPYIRSLAKKHLLLVVFFENTSLLELTGKTAEHLEDVYIKTIAEKFLSEKRWMVKELQKYGITSILTPPHLLTTQTINKYLELKARQII